MTRHATRLITAEKHARSTNNNPKCEPPEAKRIVIVDDHPLFRKGLAELIHSEKNHFAVCGEAGNAAEAMEVIRKLNPELAIVDLSLPGANGIEIDQKYPRRISEAANSGALDAR